MATTSALPPISELNLMDHSAFVLSVGILFEPCSYLTSELYNNRPYNSYGSLIQSADKVMNTADYENQVKILAAHPMIGQTKNLSAHSAKEQGSGDGTPAEVIELLAVLNKEYQDKFGFCFVVFVNGRPKKDIIPVLESRLGNTKEEECKEGLKAMVLIAEDRFKKMNVA